MPEMNRKNVTLIGIAGALVVVAAIVFLWDTIFSSRAAAPAPSAADEAAAAKVSQALHADENPTDNSPPTAPRGSGRLGTKGRK